MKNQLSWQGIRNQRRIDFPLHFRFDKCLHFLGRNLDECLFSIKNEKVYKLLKDANNLFLIEIKEVNEQLTVSCLNSQPNEDDWNFILKYVEEWFDLNRPLDSFYHLASKDQILSPLIHHYHGLRLIRMPELFEAISWAIIGQQINLSFAYRLKKRWVLEANNHLAYEGQLFYTLPTPQQTLNISDERFRELQFSRQKIKYLKIVAEHLQKGSLNKVKLLALSPDEVIHELTKIKGIGPWTANYVMMKCLGISSAFPIQDVGLHNAMKVQLGKKEKPTIAEIKELAKNWHPWEAYATFYLWRSLI